MLSEGKSTDEMLKAIMGDMTEMDDIMKDQADDTKQAKPAADLAKSSVLEGKSEMNLN